MQRICKEITHARCGETSDFSTSVMWRNLKLLNMWRNVRFLHISTMWRNLKLLHMLRNFRFLHICHAYKFEISPHDNFSPHISYVIYVTNMRYVCSAHCAQFALHKSKLQTIHWNANVNPGANRRTSSQSSRIMRYL